MKTITPMRAVSLKEALAKTVKLLIKEGITVQFRGFQPFVETERGTGRVIRLVLPEINDEISPGLLKALHGYLDHEVGHILYTEFTNIPTDQYKAQMANLIEDVRLEKLLPRDLPGTKENLAKTYDFFIPELIDKPMQEEIGGQNRPDVLFGMTIIPAFRAMGGQKAFREYMDQHGLWKHIDPLVKRYPEIEDDLMSMETYADVLAIVEKVMKAIADQLPPPPPMMQGAHGEEEESDEETENQEQGDGDAESSGEEEENDDQSGGDQKGDESEDGEEDENGESSSGGEEDDEGEDGDEESSSESGSGDEEDEQEQEDGSDGDGDESDEESGSDGDESGDKSESDAEDGDEQDGDQKDGSGKKDNNDKSGPDAEDQNASMMDALKQVNPLHRKALYEYKHNKKSTTQIAKDMQCSKQEVEGYLQEARSTIHRVMKRSET